MMELSLLNELQEVSCSDYVIHGVNTNEPLSENALARVINRNQNRIGIPHWTAHDLRRTFWASSLSFQAKEYSILCYWDYVL